MRDNLRRMIDQHSDEPWCPVTATIQIMGNKWDPVVIYRLLEHGPLRFSDLKKSTSGISSKSLSKSLKTLEENHLIERTVVSERPHHVMYRLTDHGEAIEPVIRAMEDWGDEYLCSMIKETKHGQEPTERDP
ncbi:winged helix-turn-helix transcriptional regulator [Natrinema altunense]|nr:helix-turn-helix domain-containing protein [Natrinema altunense]